VTRRHLTNQDFAARLGGEEFMLVLPVSDPAEARNLVEGILMGMRSQRFKDAPGLVVTVSGGLAMLNPGETPAQLIKRADQALYRAKETGRDRLIVGETE
jgi:diguanylate cyclase (GGDEF)-like protein